MSFHAARALALLCLAAPVSALDLLGAYEQALKHDADYLSAAASRDADRKEVAKAWSGFLPSLGASATVSDNETENTQLFGGGLTATSRADYRSESYNVTFRQPLYRKQNWGQYWQARAFASRADAAFRQEGQSLGLRVAGAYFETLLAQGQLQTESARREALERTLGLAERALAGGAGTLTDVLEVRARRDVAQASVIEADNGVQNALAMLQSVVSTTTDSLARLDISRLPLELPSEPLEKWLEVAESSNPALDSLKAEIEYAVQDAAKTRSGHYPTLDLVATHRRASNELEVSLNHDTITSLVGLQASLPLFSGGYVWAAVSQAQARVEKAKQRLEGGRREVGRLVRKEYGNIKQNAARVKALRQAVASVQEALAATEKGVEAGTRTTVDVLNAQDLVFRTQVELSKAAYYFAMSFLRLQDAAGTLNEASFRTADSWLAK